MSEQDQTIHSIHQYAYTIPFDKLCEQLADDVARGMQERGCAKGEVRFSGSAVMVFPETGGNFALVWMRPLNDDARRTLFNYVAGRLGMAPPSFHPVDHLPPLSHERMF